MNENKNKGLIICIIILIAIIFAGGIAFSYQLGKNSNNQEEEAANTAAPTPSIEEQNYQKAIELRSQGMYQDAADLFRANGAYKDSMEQYYQTLYELGQEKMSESAYEEAKSYFSRISGYQDADKQAMDCDYKIAVGYYRDGKYKKALALFRKLESNEDTEKYVNKCTKKIKQAQEYFQVGYVVYDSEEEERGRYYTNGEGKLRLNSDLPLDDWVGLPGGTYVTYTMPRSIIKFRLQNTGKKALKNPVMHIYFDEVWLRHIEEPFQCIDSDHVHGIGAYRGAVWEKNGTINAGASEYMTFTMQEAYFCNGKNAVMTIEVSADNYKKRVYKVDVDFYSQNGLIVISKIQGSTMHYYDAVLMSEILIDPNAERVVGYGEEKQIEISKNAKYYLMNFNKQSNYKVSKNKFTDKLKKEPFGEWNEDGTICYYGMACSMTINNDRCVELREEFQP